MIILKPIRSYVLEVLYNNIYVELCHYGQRLKITYYVILFILIEIELALFILRKYMSNN